MFGVKKLKIDSGLTIWIKKLNVLDFTGCSYVPLVYSYVENNPKHRRKTDTAIDAKESLKNIFYKAIVKVKTKPKMTLDTFIDGVIENENIREMLYTLIYTETFKKKIIRAMNLTVT